MLTKVNDSLYQLQTVHGLVNVFIKKGHRRNTTVSVLPIGALVRCDYRAKTERIEAFILEVKSWLEEQYLSQRKRAINQWGIGLPIQYLGKSIIIQADPDNPFPHYIGNYDQPTDGDILYLPLTPDASPQAVKQQAQFWLARRAEAWFEQRFTYFKNTRKLSPSAWRISDAKTRWGQCNHNGVISLNWRIVHFAPEYADGIIAHELAHLRVMNHSPKFWRELERILPGYQHAKQYLSQFTIWDCE